MEHDLPDPNFSVHVLITLLASGVLEQQEQEHWSGGEIVSEKEGTAAGTGEPGLPYGSGQGMVSRIRQDLPLQQQVEVSWCKRGLHCLLKGLAGRMSMSSLQCSEGTTRDCEI